MLFPVMPRGEMIARYDTYGEAQKMVDKLGQHDFPLRRVAIIGADLKSVERVTGKRSYGRAAGTGLFSGVWFGLFFGIILLLFTPEMPVDFLLAAALIGAGCGMIFALIAYAVTRRQRDFRSIIQMVATTYSIMVDPEVADKARTILGATETRGRESADGESESSS